MPFHPSDLEEYFGPLAEDLEAIAETEGLRLEKYYHDAPAWSLCFGHPNGGQAKIDVSATGEDEVTIQAAWWLDEFRTFTRSLLWGRKTICRRESQAVASLVQQIFTETLAWQSGNWTQVADGYEPYWSSIGASSFEAWANPWLLPTRRA